MIVAQNVSKSFGATTALQSLSLEVGPGEVLGLLGPWRREDQYAPPTRRITFSKGMRQKVGIAIATSKSAKATLTRKQSSRHA